MPDNRFRVRGEKLTRSLDDFIRQEFPDREHQAQVRRAVIGYLQTATVSVDRPRRPFPGEEPVDELPGDWN